MDRRSFLCRLGAAACVMGGAPPTRAQAQEAEVAPLRRFASDAFGWLSAQPENFYGWNPSLARPIPGQSAVRQVGSLAALARYTRARNESETLAPDQILARILRWNHRRQQRAFDEAHPVGLASLLLLAIVEGSWFPTQGSQVADQLVEHLERRQRPDGTIRLGLSDDPRDDEGFDDFDEVAYYPGEALYAIARWSLAANESTKAAVILERAFEPYRGHWRRHRQLAFIPWQTGAFAEAFLATGQRDFADFVFEMNDWLVPLQYVAGSSTPSDWVGGFDFRDANERFHAPPGATTGSYAEALVDALRVAKAVGDQARVDRYEAALLAALQFLTTIQYTAANTAHFQPETRQKLLGAIHAGVEDGMVRIDFTQHALMAASQYLIELVDRRNAKIRNTREGLPC